MHPVEALLNAKLEGLKVLRSHITVKRSSMLERAARYTDVLYSVEIDKKSIEAIKIITERLSATGVRHIQGMVTRGLRAIFTDDRYEFEIEVMERGTSKATEFYVRDSRGNRTPIDKCGGGLIVMSSFLMRVYLIMRLKLMRLVVLDEAFIQVSAEYTEGLMTFLHTLVKDAGFRFLWVSHSQNYIDGADHVFEIRRGVLHRVEGYKAH